MAFTDNFESGSLSAWNYTYGDVSIITNPFGSGHVLECDGQSNNYDYVAQLLDLPSTWTASIDVYIPAATLSALSGQTYSATFIEFGDGLFLYKVSGVWKCWTDWAPGAANGTFTADTWHTITVQYDGTTITWKLDGTTIFSYDLDVGYIDQEWDIGALAAKRQTNELYYIDNANLPGTIAASISVSGDGLVGNTVTVSGSGFNPNSALTATLDGNPLTIGGTTTTDSAGNFTGMTFEVPSMPTLPQSYLLIITDASSKSGSIYFYIHGPLPVIHLSADHGGAGDQITISGENFAPNSALTGMLNNYLTASLSGTTTTASDGSFTGLIFTIPNGVSGFHWFDPQQLEIGDASNNWASAVFHIDTSATATPDTGGLNDTITIVGTGFAPNSNITADLIGTYLTPVGAHVSDANGDFNIQFTITSVPNTQLPANVVLYVRDASNNFDGITFHLLGATVTVTPATGGKVGDTFTVNLVRFPANAALTFWLAPRWITNTVSGSHVTDGNGSYTGTFVLQPGGIQGNARQLYVYAGSTYAIGNFTIDGPTIVITDPVGEIHFGDTVTIHGTNFSPNSAISLYLDYDLHAFSASTTDENGEFTGTFVYDLSYGGHIEIEVYDATNNLAIIYFDTANPSITISPQQGPYDVQLTITGRDFAPGYAISEIGFGVVTITEWTGDTIVRPDGSFVITIIVPSEFHGTYTYDVSVTTSGGQQAWDQLGYTVCLNASYDSIDLTVNPPMIGYPDTGTFGVGYGTAPPFEDGDYSPEYCHGFVKAQGSYWELYTLSDLRNVGVDEYWTIFPPPEQTYSMAVLRTSEDGSSSDVYYIEIPIRYSFDHTIDSYLFYQTWEGRVHFIDWSYRVISADIQTDGENIWVGAVVAETLEYPYLSSDDGSNPPDNPYYPGCTQTAQFLPLSSRTATYSEWTHKYHAPSNVPSAGTTPPDSDGGDGLSGFYTVAQVKVYSFSGSGFNEIGGVDARYNRLSGGRYDGGFWGDSHASQIAMCASPAEPGVCHVVWSEMGQWGTKGKYGPYNYEGGIFPHGPWEAFDGGSPNWSSRMSYSRWSSSGKTLDVDLLDVTVNRTDHFYGDYISKGWWPSANINETSLVALKNDHGSPVAFISRYLTKVDSNGVYTPDGAEPLISMYDLSGGSLNLLQTITSDLLPTAEEASWQSTPIPPPAPYAGPPNRLYYTWPGTGYYGETRYGVTSDYFGFGVSDIYADPLLSGDNVYLLHVGFLGPGVSTSEERYSQGFYRVRCDGSTPFDLMDGSRDWSILPSQWNPNVKIPVRDFFSEPKNVWVPDTDQYIYYLDRSRCHEGWLVTTYAKPQPPGIVAIRQPGMCKVVYDGADHFYYPAWWTDDANSPGYYNDQRYGVGIAKICRNCENCRCAGVRQSIFWFMKDGEWHNAGVDEQYNLWYFKDGEWRSHLDDGNYWLYGQLDAEWQN